MSKKKRYLLLLLTLLLLSAITATLYLLVDQKSNTTISVNKYSDVTEWCDTRVEDNSLDVDCKGLLLHIRNLEEDNNCFDVEIITRNKELKDISICEVNEGIKYTDEVLGYEMLMPVNITFSYTSKNPPTNYVFKEITFTELEDTYIQDIVNEDIEEIISMDKNTTSVLNSFDFCPKPDILPDYAVEKEQYAKFWNDNILSEQEYMNGWNYSLDDTTPRLLFACVSSKNVGYTDVCSAEKIIAKNLVSSNTTDLNTTPNWTEMIPENDMRLLKEISLIYDNMYLKEKYVTSSGETVLNKLVEDINSTSINEEVFCSVYKLFKNTGNEKGLRYIEDTVLSNISKLSSSLCSETHSNVTDKSGAYLKIYFSPHAPEFKIMDRCQNLTYLLNEAHETEE